MHFNTKVALGVAAWAVGQASTHI